MTTVGGGTVEQQRIARLKDIEQTLIGIIANTEKVQGSYPEFTRAKRYLIQVQLERVKLEIDTVNK